MTKTILLAASIALSGAAFAQKPAPKAPAKKPAKVAKKAPVKTTCAIMPKDVIEVSYAEKNGLFSDYNGKRYYFCCPGCKPAFQKEPAKYAKAAKGFPIPGKKAPAKKPA